MKKDTLQRILNELKKHFIQYIIFSIIFIFAFYMITMVFGGEIKPIKVVVYLVFIIIVSAYFAQKV
ncbi:c-di-AMP phosphodiesterase-like protein [Breznakia pachnodae]|uniref:C-di-AMP phosphodiesterase-like protein n=1 Tax=Breznakia pachnodae TaxID=265178 RepID=A0ABU0E4F1_9FIRM|nr:c-di-AMP phosphodiesterase-like protein [Breznakia pachnodae]